MAGSQDWWWACLGLFQPVFTTPGFAVFIRLASAWVRCPGRHTLTRLYALAEPAEYRAHDAYHRFFPQGAWSLGELWRLLAQLLVATFYPHGVIPLDLDDTLFHKSGRNNQSAAWWRDAVRSTGQKVVHCFGLNLVVLTLRVVPPWGGEPLGLPVSMRLHRKKGRGLLDLAHDMMEEWAAWFPERCFSLCADGFYAPLAGAGLPRTEVTSRIRRDAALFAPLPACHRRKRKQGRPRTKGRRLPTPEQMARTRLPWRKVTVLLRGKPRQRWVHAQPVLWYHVCPRQPILLVICRDPSGHEPDDFFFTTNLQAAAAQVIEQYAGRWSIEDTFKNTKQHLGGQDPQVWKDPGPERVAAFSFWLYSLVWFWYLTAKQKHPAWLLRPWYPQKTVASFADALASLRRELWWRSISSQSEDASLSHKNITQLIDTLAYAA